MASTNPLFNENRLKVGIFCTNGAGTSFSLAPEAPRASWDRAVRTAQVADRAGLEAVVPFSRWKGYPENQPTHYSGEVYDPFTFAAGIAQATDHIGIFATANAPTVHPIVAAKQSATIDAISGGRFALNVVAGWNKPEMDMFGADMREHEGRYAQVAEWVEVLRLLWSETDEFDFDGEFYTIRGGVSQPKPLQSPPPLMNAGNSTIGAQFAAKNADVCFILPKSNDEAQLTAQVDRYKNMARDEFDREVQVWAPAYVVQADTQQEADAYLHRYAVEYEDSVAVDAWIRSLGLHSGGLSAELLESLRVGVAAGAAGYPLVGTAETISEELAKLSRAGVDGVLLSWFDYDDGLARFTSTVLPSLEAAGLRKPFRP